MGQTCDLGRGCGHELKRDQHFLDRLSAGALRDLKMIQVQVSHGANVVLFSEREKARGLFIVLDGQVRLSIGSSDGRRLNLKIARKGDILGLVPAAFDEPHAVTAETLCPAKLSFIDRADFCRFLARYPGAYAAITKELSGNFNMACEQLRTLALSSTVRQKLARLLLAWCEVDQVSGAGTIQLALKQEDIGEFIGAARETVARTLKLFKVHRLIAFQGSLVMIPDRAALESVAFP
jgi:CRP/FNR family transcriptional regulator, cyclic AMP receptor protein